jgi:hypothetical protein
MSALDPGAQAPAPEPVATPEPASSGPDLSPVFDRLDQLGGMVGQLTEQFQGYQQAQQPQEQETNWFESLYADPNEQPQEPQQPVDQFGNPIQQQPAQQQLNPDALQNAINQAIQQSTAPLQQQLQSFQQQQALNTLLERVPSLKDPDTAQRTQELVAQQIGHLSPEVQQALAWDPGFIETVFKAAEAEKLAGAQEPAGGQVPQLEAAGGAHPGGTGEEQNIVHRVHGGRVNLPRGLGN